MLDFSERIRVRSDSKTEFNLSSTESLARDISSISSNPPFYIDSTSMPSCHSKIQDRSSFKDFKCFSSSFISPESSINFENFCIC